MKTMKQKIAQILLVTGLSALASCSDFLSQSSPSEVDYNDVYESIAYTGTVINSLYGDMGKDDVYSQQLSIIWGTNSDCELIDGIGNDAYNTSRERGNMNYNASPAWSDIADVWDTMYGIIEKANLAITGIEQSSLMQSGTNSDRTTMGRYKGEALTVRAMIYFDLIRNFGDVPMKMEPSNTDLSNVYVGKTDRDVLMDRLMNDLDEAIELLPWAGEVSEYTTERMTKGYAHALLANIALTRAGWMIRESAKAGYETAEYSDATYPTQRCDAATRKSLYERALKHLSAVITSNRHHLNPSFENEWYLINQRILDQTYRENLFEIPMGIEESSELGYTIGVRCNGQTTQYGHNSTGKQKLTAPYLWSFRDNDQRRDITCANFDIREENGTTVEKLLGNNPFGIYVGKWDIRKMSEENINLAANTLGDTKWMSGINCVRMRYSQVLLMYAEVMNELAGPTGSYEGSAGISAKAALAEVHNRAFSITTAEESYLNSVSTDRTTFFNAIVDENAWELAGEGFRKYDLIRWNLLVEKILQFKSDYLKQMNGAYQRTIYFNYLDAAHTQIDMSSITYKGLPAGKSTSDYHASVSSWGNERTTSTKTQSETNLPSISSGLVGSTQQGSGNGAAVKNRYLMPIASTTISASNGRLSNSYGYSN